MQVIQVQVGNVLYPLAEGQPIPVRTGDTIKVFFGFKYKIPETTDVEIWASLYKQYTARIDRADDAQTKGTVTLEETLEWKEFSGVVDILIPQVSGEVVGLVTPGIDEGLWGLIVELPDYGVDDRIGDCIEAIAAPGLFDIIGMIGPLIVLGLMAFMIPMMMPKEEAG